MKKVIAVVAIGLSLAWGGVQADDFEDGVELGVGAMQTKAYLCFEELNQTLKGYESKHLKDMMEEFFRGRPDLPPAFVESFKRGYQLEGLDDPALREAFKSCIDQGVRGTLEAIDR
ncbi:hypothetical protein GGR41_000575 [Paenalcaligenes hominis]|uniref:Uncharacterized protein n=1 Tax=Paenalcaligenes hominis TaxID=643674 RepID=A0ABX0WNI6_9BURK|nr:hypothetical protein [Paenalcaligenes hominis]NJB64354.1 hypothetical protein [Paenalcaligenes hominis]GGE68286.1 hypothetical protein GCM10007278_15470 [Paenalcaligenes hominis]